MNIRFGPNNSTKRCLRQVGKRWNNIEQVRLPHTFHFTFFTVYGASSKMATKKFTQCSKHCQQPFQSYRLWMISCFVCLLPFKCMTYFNILISWKRSLELFCTVFWTLHHNWIETITFYGTRSGFFTRRFFHDIERAAFPPSQHDRWNSIIGRIKINMEIELAALIKFKFTMQNPRQIIIHSEYRIVEKWECVWWERMRCNQKKSTTSIDANANENKYMELTMGNNLIPAYSSNSAFCDRDFARSCRCK